jgi:hypothetical protein
MSRAEWKLIFYDGQRELTEMCVSKQAALRVARGKKQHHDVLRIISPVGKKIERVEIDKWCKNNPAWQSEADEG